MENLPTPATKTSVKHSIYFMLASAIVIVGITSCGTVRGIGHDVETVGNGIEKSTR
jgi:predicted small secreted protein